MPDLSSVHRMMAYTAWADDVMLRNAEQLPDHDLMAPRDALFESIAGTFDHILVVAEIFQSHLEGRIIRIMRAIEARRSRFPMSRGGFATMWGWRGAGPTRSWRR